MSIAASPTRHGSAVFANRRHAPAARLSRNSRRSRLMMDRGHHTPAVRRGSHATMCYMLQPDNGQAVRPLRPDRVGVRELRQNLSVYLERVIAGERLEVTDRGNPVAMLIPIRPGATLVERLVAEGRAIPATRDPRSLAALPPVEISDDVRRRIWEAFEETREDRL